MIELLTNLKKEMFTAIKEKDHDISGIIQLSLASIKNLEIEKGEELNEEEVLEALRREVKKLNDSIEQFTAAGEEKLLTESLRQKEYLEQYLPKLMDKDAVEAHVKKIIEEMGVSSKREMGQVMGRVMSDLKGKADGNLVKEVVMANLD